MRKLTKGSIATVVVYGLVLAVALPGLALSAAIATAETARAKVVVLPLANNTQVGGAELATRVQQALQTTLAASDRATMISLRASSPAVRRAISIEKTLEPSDLDITPPANRAQAERIGRALGADVVLWGSVEEYTSDAKTKQVTIGLSIYKLDLRTDQVNAIAVAGKSAEKVGFAGGEGPLMNEAIDSAVLQAAQQALGIGIVAGQKPTAPTPAPTIRRKKDKTWQYVGAAIAAAAVIALASKGGEGGAAPTPPGMVADAIATPTANTVELSWQSPAGASGVTGFNVFRAAMGGTGRAARVARAATSRVRVTRQAGGYSLLAIVGKGDRIYNDTSANVGTLYAYRIAAVAGPVESAQVDFYSYYEMQRGAVGVIEVGPAWPTAPAMPSATAFLQSVALQWSPNPEGFIESYRVYRSSSATGPWDNTTLLGQVAANKSTYEDSSPGLVAGHVYFYAIGAVTAATSANGRIGPPLQVTFTPGKPAPPSNVVAEPRIEGVTLTWTASPDTSVTGYRIFRNGAQIAQVGLVTTYADTPLAAGSYAYAVAAVASATESDRIAAVPSPVSPSSPPSALTITPLAGPVVANGTSTANIIATATTAGGSPVQGVEVVFSLVPLTGGGTLIAHPSYPATTVPAGLRVLTDAAGKAAVRFQAGTNAAATPVVTARCLGAGGVTLIDSITITLTARQIAGITLAAELTTLPGDGMSTTLLTATVSDQGGGGMPEVTVNFVSQAPTLGVFDPSVPSVPDHATGVTGPDGKTTATLRSASMNQFGNCVVTATAVGAPAGTPAAQLTIHFVAAPRVTVNLDPRVLPAAGLGATSLITATVKYVTGDPVADGTVIRFAFEGGETMSNTGALIANGRQRVLTQNGIAYSTLLSAVDLTHGDSDVVWAWIDTDDDGVWDGSAESLGSAVVTYTDPPFRVSVTAEPMTLPADNRSVSKIVADVRTNVPDASAGGFKPVADGTLVEVRTSAGTFIESGTTLASGRTVGGLVTVFLKAPNTQAVATVTATAGLISGSNQVEFIAPVNVVVTLTATPASLQADGIATSDILVRVTDNNGTPKASASVDLATTLGALLETKLTTDEKGEATTTFTAGTVSGTATLVAKSGGATGFITITLTSGVPQNTSLTIMAPNVTMPATNGQTSPSGASPTASVFARVTDKYGNPVVEGTPVFFHTDIGQVDGSVPTEDGLAEATLVTGSFTDATNKATFRPGRATVTAWANGQNGPASSTPEHAIFCGDFDAFNWDGSANDSDVWTPYGADWRLGSTGSSDLSQPHVTPKAGDLIEANMILADRNNNPLPHGVTVHWEFFAGATLFASVDDLTETYFGPAGVAYCKSVATATLTKFPDQVTVENVRIVAKTPAIITTYSEPYILQLVGAAGPSGNITVGLGAGGSIIDNNVRYTFTAVVVDEYGNPVQDGNPVYFAATDPGDNIADVKFDPNPAFTVGGTATSTVMATLVDVTQSSTFTLAAGSPQPPMDADAVGTLSLTVNPTAAQVLEFTVVYPDENAQLVRSYPVGPGLQLIENAFSVINTGTDIASIYAQNTPDVVSGKVYPDNYITFREHLTTPPAGIGQPILGLVNVPVGRQVFVDVIVQTDGLTVAGSPFGSTISLFSPTADIVYAPVANPQRLLITVQ